MPEKSHATTTTLFHRRNHGMDEATKAGIGATVCSAFILAIVFLAMHTLPSASDNDRDSHSNWKGSGSATAFATGPVPLQH